MDGWHRRRERISVPYSFPRKKRNFRLRTRVPPHGTRVPKSEMENCTRVISKIEIKMIRVPCGETRVSSQGTRVSRNEKVLGPGSPHRDTRVPHFTAILGVWPRAAASNFDLKMKAAKTETKQAGGAEAINEDELYAAGFLLFSS